MPAIFEFLHQVTSDEIDEQGHVNNLCYLHWMQDAAIAHSHAQGWSSQRYHATGGAWVARSHKIEYQQSAFLNDEVIVRTWIYHFKKVSSGRKYRVIREADQAVLAIAETEWAYISLENYSPRRIPNELRDSFTIIEEVE